MYTVCSSEIKSKNKWIKQKKNQFSVKKSQKDYDNEYIFITFFITSQYCSIDSYISKAKFKGYIQPYWTSKCVQPMFLYIHCTSELRRVLKRHPIEKGSFVEIYFLYICLTIWLYGDMDITVIWISFNWKRDSWFEVWDQNKLVNGLSSVYNSISQRSIFTTANVLKAKPNLVLSC